MLPEQPSLFPGSARALATDEVAALLARAIRAGGAGCLSRHGDVFLATLCADVLADRLAREGVVLIRQAAPNHGGEDRARLETA